MTRLSEALKRAAAETAAMPVSTSEPMPAPDTTWQFAPVETMHVPDEPAVPSAFARPAPSEPRRPEPPAAPLESVEPHRLESASAPVELPKPHRDPAAAPAIPFGDADRNKLIVGDHVDPAMIEQYRHLAAAMHHAQQASGVRSVMVTSALPAEGKTLTATNLALTLSQSYQRRVLLVDADLRRPRMREMFALPSSVGLTDSLTLSRTDRLPVQQITPTLWVLTSGRAVPDPMSLLVSPAMKQLL